MYLCSDSGGIHVEDDHRASIGVVACAHPQQPPHHAQCMYGVCKHAGWQEDLVAAKVGRASKASAEGVVMERETV